MKNKYPKLFQFLGCYFHQDWMCDSSDPDDIIRTYIADSAPQNIKNPQRRNFNATCNQS
ncbi:contact-dependent growth inhibition system immunity protein [Pseudomonas frederiksbergensis]|uniref:contact-dependent growth inhibition system immunity protein n=1 Tax=Pseudomonas frederiksbergensis TaxID=104087 RepID=UPI001364C5AA